MTPRLCTPIALCLALASAVPAHAQTTAADNVASHTDWSVFVAASPRECYIVSPPTASTARRGGASVEAQRGDIRVFVTFRPDDNVVNEVSFAAGYPLSGDPVEVEIGGQTFNLNPGPGDNQEWAWPASPQEDAQLVAAMRGGSSARVTGVSTRGTTTVDTFSLSGFTAAINDAEARCR